MEELVECENICLTPEKRHQKYFLRFSSKENIALAKTDVKDQMIHTADYLINKNAVGNIMEIDGTVP